MEEMAKQQFTDASAECIKNALTLAVQNKHQYATTTHLLLAMLAQEDGMVPDILIDAQAQPSIVLSELKKDLLQQKTQPEGSNANPECDRGFLECTTKATQVMTEFNDTYISVDVLLIGIAYGSTTAQKILKKNGCDLKKIKDVVAKKRAGRAVTEKGSEKNFQSLQQFSTDLTQQAKDGKIDPVIGRDQEIRRVVQILSRRRKNNPVVVGEPGIGKTAIIEGLARRIVDGDVPLSLKNKKIYSLNLSAMLAGSSLRGQFEERLKSALDDIVASNGKIITFIDEIHTIVGAGGGGSDNMDASNMIKPLLARGELHLVGATTLDEYRKYIEKDPALERRFQQVRVDPPSVEDTVAILRGIKEQYETHHGVRIQDSALVAAAQLSDRYITNRFLPDKAIDLIDEACSRLRMEIDSSPEEIDELDRSVRRLEIEEVALRQETDLASQERHEKLVAELQDKRNKLEALQNRWVSEKKIIDQSQEQKRILQDLETQYTNAERSGDIQRASEIRYTEIPQVKEKIAGLEKLMQGGTLLAEEVTPDVISDVVSSWTGIPAGKMLSSEMEHLMDMEKVIGQRVIGQDEAISAIAKAVRRSRSGVADPNKPTGSFLFLGKSGTGKSELAKSVSRFLFNDIQAMVRIDMSEYSEKHDVAKLIGAPPGYVGYDQGGVLTEAVRRRPYTLVLFDEVEKAHPEIFDILLQVLDEGRLTDSQGRLIDFKNTIIVLTSNLGARGTKNDMINAARKFFKPEFINRLDALITFNDLTHDALVRIVDIQMSMLQKRMDTRHITVDLHDDARDWIADNGYDPLYGARPISRLIQEAVGDPLSTGIITGEITDGDTVEVTVDTNDNYPVVTPAGSPQTPGHPDESERHTPQAPSPTGDASASPVGDGADTVVPYSDTGGIFGHDADTQDGESGTAQDTNDDLLAKLLNVDDQ